MEVLTLQGKIVLPPSTRPDDSDFVFLLDANILMASGLKEVVFEDGQPKLLIFNNNHKIKPNYTVWPFLLGLLGLGPEKVFRVKMTKYNLEVMVETIVSALKLPQPEWVAWPEEWPIYDMFHLRQPDPTFRPPARWLKRSWRESLTFTTMGILPDGSVVKRKEWDDFDPAYYK